MGDVAFVRKHAKLWPVTLVATALVTACGGEVSVGDFDDGDAFTTVEPTDCGAGALRYSGVVDGEEVDEEWCADGVRITDGGPHFFYFEYRIDGGFLGPAFLADGEPVGLETFSRSSLDRAIVAWRGPMLRSTDAILCGGADAELLQWGAGRDDPAVPITLLRLPTLSWLNAPQPGRETLHVDWRANTVVGSFGNGFEATLVNSDHAATGEFRLKTDNGAYVFARYDSGGELEAGTFELEDAYVWYGGEFFGAGSGVITLVEDEDGTNVILDIEGLGSAGTCPGTPIDGELTVYTVRGVFF